jgi:geranylgeranyl diphosphate synthase type I
MAEVSRERLEKRLMANLRLHASGDRRASTSLGLSLPRPRTFAELLDRACGAVEAELAARLGGAVERWEAHGVGTTASALADLVLRGGKRLRAGLVVAAWWAVRPRSSATPAVFGAAALELLHAYLLVQDDWMDGDDQRRGGPSVHAALGALLGDAAKGAASALLASDLGLGLALQSLLDAPVPSARIQQALGHLLAEHERVLIGQQLDLLGGTRRIETMHELKTASYSFRAPLLVGAALAGADARVERALARFAAPVGVAFQLRDDLLGVFAPSDLTGKPFAGDLREGKTTAVTAAARRALRGRAARRFERTWGCRDAGASALRETVADMAQAGVRASVERRIAELSAAALRSARRLPVDAVARGWLGEVVELVRRPIVTALRGEAG